MEPSSTLAVNTPAISMFERRDAILSASAYAGQQFLRSDDWNAAIDAVLARFGQAAGVARVYVFEDHSDPAGNPVASLRHEWVAAGERRLLAASGLQNVRYFARSTAHWRARLEMGETVSGVIDQSSPAERRVLRLLLVRSFVAVPVFVAGQWWGAIGFADTHASRDWSETEVDALQIAGSLFGAAIERQKIAAERAESERFWSMMSCLNVGGLQAVDEDTLVSTTVEQLTDVIHADQCAILLWDEGKEVVTIAAATPRVRQLLRSPGRPIPAGPIVLRLLKERRPLIYDDLATLDPDNSELMARIPVVAGIAVPMVAQEEVLGAVLLGFTEPHRITAVEQLRAEFAAQQLARFLFNARLLKAERLARRQAETMQAVSQVISSTLNLREVLERILSELQQIVPYDSASVQRLEGDESVILAGRGFSDPGQRVGLAFDISDPDLPNHAIYEQRRSVILPDVSDTHGRFGAVVDASEYIHSWLGVPLLFGGRTIGMLTLDKTEPGFYTEQHARLVEMFAAQAAIALENARLFEMTQQLNIQIWRQARQLRRVIDTVSDGIVLLDERHAIVLANTPFYSYLPALTAQAEAATLDQICGRPVDWFLEHDGGVGWREVAAVGEIPRLFAISANRVSIGDDAGGLVLSVSDVTVERQQRDLRRAQERLATIGAMAGGIAHDFNNILQGIIGFADLLSRNPDIPATARQRLALMAREGQRGADLIRLIVEYSREVPLSTRPIDLAALITEAARQWEVALQRPVVVSLESGAPVETVDGDAMRLQETLTSLVTDAAQTLPPGRPVMVTVTTGVVNGKTGEGKKGNNRSQCVAVEITGGDTWFASPEQVRALEHDLPLINAPAGRDVMLARVQGVVRQHRGAITVEPLTTGGHRVAILLPAAAPGDAVGHPADAASDRMQPWRQ